MPDTPTNPRPSPEAPAAAPTTRAIRIAAAASYARRAELTANPVSWDHLPGTVQDEYVECFRAGLEELGIIPIKPKTRGHEIARHMVPEDGYDEDIVAVLHPQTGLYLLSLKVPEEYLTTDMAKQTLRDVIAFVADRERQQAYAHAAHLAENIGDHPRNYTLTDDWPKLVARKIASAIREASQQVCGPTITTETTCPT